MNAIGYVRVSTDRQALDGVSLRSQKQKIESWAELHDYNLVNVFQDEGMSGASLKGRDGLQNALESISNGSVLIVYSLSRLARSTKDTLDIAEQLESKGADLVSISEKIDTTSASGKMVFRMLAVLSEFERDQVSERTRMALAHKRTHGWKTGGLVPYGYKSSSGSLSIDPKEHEVIELIHLLRSRGMSLRQIGQELAIRQIRTKTGKNQWNPKTIASLLKRTEKRPISVN